MEKKSIEEGSEKNMKKKLNILNPVSGKLIEVTDESQICSHCGAELNVHAWTKKLPEDASISEVLKAISEWEKQLAKHDGREGASCAEKYGKSGRLTI